MGWQFGPGLARRLFWCQLTSFEGLSLAVLWAGSRGRQRGRVPRKQTEAFQSLEAEHQTLHNVISIPFSQPKKVTDQLRFKGWRNKLHFFGAGAAKSYCKGAWIQEEVKNCRHFAI